MKKHFGLKAEIAFFILTALAVQLLYWLCDLLIGKTVIAAVIALAVAEWLIRRYGFWRTGVEEGLWIGGLIAFLRTLPESGHPQIALAAVFAIAGLRLRKALFGAAAAVLAILWIEAIGFPVHALVGGFLAGAIAAAGAAAWPSMLLSLVTVGAPLAGYVAYSDHDFGALPGIAALSLGFAIVNLIIGIATRTRAPLIAGAACAAMAAYEIHPLIHVTPEAKFIGAGAILLAIATTLMRALRDKTSGIVVTPAKAHELQELAQAAVTVPMATPEAAGPPQTVSGGGEFGGAGASGDF
jgi:hypothetical protein